MGLGARIRSDAGFSSGRNAYAPFQDRDTDIIVLAGKYFLDVGTGLEIFGKIKMIDETDKRMNDASFLPYVAGDCPGGGVACANNQNFYSPGNSSAALYGNPPVITVGGNTGYQWKPFDNLADDDREMDYTLYQLGGSAAEIGKQNRINDLSLFERNSGNVSVIEILKRF